jgi:cytochrome c oxidase subunit 2
VEGTGAARAPLRYIFRALQIPGPKPRPSRLLVLAASFAGVFGVSLALAPAALAGFITPPTGASPNANQEHSLYMIILYIAAVVFVAVEGTLVYAVWRFRAKKNRVASQLHGNTPLEIGWTAAAALILVVLAIVTFIKLPSIVNAPNSSPNGLVLSASITAPKPPNGKKLLICVQGRQFIWRYVYGNGCLENYFTDKLPYSYTTMYVPAHTTVVLAIQSSDVIHSWWVPAMGGKVDAVPGFTTYTWFKAERANVTYRGQCAQLCGVGHAAMDAFVHVLTPSAYKQWLVRQSTLIAEQNAQVGQLRKLLEKEGQLASGV